MANGPADEVLFPDPQDQLLARIKLDPDKLVYLFREATASQHREEGGSVLDGFLADALAAKHRRQAWVWTKRLNEAFTAGLKRPIAELASALSSPALDHDRAAFVPVLDRIPEALTAQLGAQVEAARAAALALQTPSLRAAYVEAGALQGEFFRSKGALRRLAGKARKGVEGLLDRLELRFSAENLARFFLRLTESHLPDRVRSRAAEAVGTLQERIVEAALADLEDDLAGGLGEAVTRIERVGGFIRTKRSLLRGRVRMVTKLIQAVKDQPRELALLVPVFDRIRRGIKGRRSRGGLDAEAAAYLVKVDEQLDQMAFFVSRWKRNPGSQPSGELTNVWEAVFQALRAEDFEGLFADLEDSAELYEGS
jgi:hypothetical protein